MMMTMVRKIVLVRMMMIDGGVGFDYDDDGDDDGDNDDE